MGDPSICGFDEVVDDSEALAVFLGVFETKDEFLSLFVVSVFG